MYKRDDGGGSHASMFVYGLSFKEFKELNRHGFTNLQSIFLKWRGGKCIDMFLSLEGIDHPRGRWPPFFFSIDYNFYFFIKKF